MKFKRTKTDVNVGYNRSAVTTEKQLDSGDYDCITSKMYGGAEAIRGGDYQQLKLRPLKERGPWVFY